MATASPDIDGSVELSHIGRIPAAGDNVAIAVRDLAAGIRFSHNGQIHTLQSNILEGQRFAIQAIDRGSALLSWGLPFGCALKPISPGEYLCNEGILEALKLRQLDFDLPDEANFRDHLEDYRLDEARFTPGRQVQEYAETGIFEGYLRPARRGIGTRNNLIILGTSSLTAGFARLLETRCKQDAGARPNIDRIVAVAHTEGANSREPNNRELVLRTLAGFMVHPNVGAVLAVDYGTEAVTNAMLQSYMRAHNYPLDGVLHHFHSLSQNFDASLQECATIIQGWLDPLSAMQRSPQPLSGLRIALQCGGSDAFSGVSGNPLAGWVAKEAIRHGGAAALAETDELIGAESYVLANVRDIDTARKFLRKIAVFKERVGWHGHSAEGNPSGGNKFRGLYNITLKSIGAARKKDPEVRLDHVIDYGQHMSAPGFYFMDSPGNDLESIAGQVAAGCNLIFFITGNGSITNFPFVPTIKFVTTTGRWKLLKNDMDINAGRYQDGESIEDLGRESFDYAVAVASGRTTVGERAGHSQVSIWRDWSQCDGSGLIKLQNRRKPDGKPIAIKPVDPPPFAFQALPADKAFAADQLGLIVPTSLCSGQVARQIANSLNEGPLASGHGVSRFVALPHTEGCGASGGENLDHFTRTLVGHLQHPFVRHALLLEHGCEQTHNDLMRHRLVHGGLDPEQFGYASIQLDGGIDKVSARVSRWFAEAMGPSRADARQPVGLEHLSLGLFSAGEVPPALALALAKIACIMVGAGGTVVTAENSGLLHSQPYLAQLGWPGAPPASLNYGEHAGQPGMHIMATPTRHLVETQTGLGGTGVQILLGFTEEQPLQGHPMIPLIQFSSNRCSASRFAADLDRVFEADESDADKLAGEMLELVGATASGKYRTRSTGSGNSDFQLTRGLLGVSL